MTLKGKTKTTFNIPRILIAGTHSGCGKTTITRAIMAALVERGLAVQPFKVGPDFIDPGFHSKICRRESENLDLMMTDKTEILSIFTDRCDGADIAVIEGVMGMYDGIDGTTFASTADLSKALNCPIILVADVKGMSTSAHALINGYATYEKLNFAGVIFNRVGSERHKNMLKINAKYPYFGFVQGMKEISVDSRHLGLKMADETKNQNTALIDASHSLDLDAIINIAKSAPPLPINVINLKQHEKKVTIGVARDEAFCFYYKHNLNSLKNAGAELVYFSPLKDHLPEVDGIYLGGGYPELHGKTLEKAPALLDIKNAAEDELPVYAECGGLMYLTKSITTDRTYRGVGILPAQSTMEKHFQALGYTIGESNGSYHGFNEGMLIHGHEFHYSKIDQDRDAQFAINLSRGKGISNSQDGMYTSNTFGSYTHAWFTENLSKSIINLSIAYQRT